MLLAAPIILPLVPNYVINTAEERANERRRERSIKAIKAKRTDGPFTELWPNGKKRVEGTYKNKELSGPHKAWHENGQKDSEGSYIDGKEHGQWKDYWADGTKRETGTYKFGKRDGLWTFYWTDSAGRNYKGIEVTWKDGTKHGLTTKWHENGKKSGEDNYINGAHDYWKSFDENGKIKNEGSYSGW